jgi:hypothetical protein
MPTYRFPEAVKSGNIPFSKGRDYKPVIGVDRLEKQLDVKVKAANNIVKLLSRSGPLSCTAKTDPGNTTALPIWDRNYKSSLKLSKTVHNVQKYVTNNNIYVKEPLGSSGARWGDKPTPYEKPIGSLNVVERSFKNVMGMKRRNKQSEKEDLKKSRTSLQESLPNYLLANDINSYFPAKKEVRRLRRIVSKQILSNENSGVLKNNNKRSISKKGGRLDWHKIEVGIASRTIHAGVGW